MRFTTDQDLKHNRTPNIVKAWERRRRECQRRRELIVDRLTAVRARMGRDLSVAEAYTALTGKDADPRKARNTILCAWGEIYPETRVGLVARMWHACGMAAPRTGRRPCAEK